MGAPLKSSNLSYLCDEQVIQSAEFIKVSEDMLKGYAHFVKSGFPAGTIALAMLGATLNLYEMFDMRSDLPEILRGVAENIENDAKPS